MSEFDYDEANDRNEDDEEYQENYEEEGDRELEEEKKLEEQNPEENANSEEKGESEILEEEEDINPTVINNRAKALQERKTPKFMTKYERARIIGTRALQISKNSPVYVDLGRGKNIVNISKQHEKKKQKQKSYKRFFK
jgi:DNA-directed RNA polymerases I, II, and III subunit RPABC2